MEGTDMTRPKGKPNKKNLEKLKAYLEKEPKKEPEKK
jgi:hypothetical protein